MTPDELRKVAVFLDALTELAEIGANYRQVGLNLYWYDSKLYIDDADGNSLVRITHDNNDGYTVQPA